MHSSDSKQANGTNGSNRLTFENLQDELLEIERKNAKHAKEKKRFQGNRTREEYSDLARDPAHGNIVKYKGQKERAIILDLERQGKVGKVIRDKQADKGADFIETKNGQRWDIKSPVSYPAGHKSGRKGAFKVENMINNVKKEINKGYKVVIDTRRLTKEHRQQFKNEVKKQGLNSKVIWYDKKGSKK